MKIRLSVLRESLENLTFRRDGDKYERAYGHLLAPNFPNCEIFWKFFVGPYAQMASTQPLNSDRNSSKLKEIETLRLVGWSHYTMFLHLVFARVHLQTRMISSIENTYSHLVSACDLADNTVAQFHLLMLKARNEETKVKCKKRKRLRECEELRKEYFGDKFSEQFNGYLNHVRNIKVLRNILVHDVMLARISSPEGYLIPKSEKARLYMKNNLGETQKAANTGAEMSNFREEYEQAEDDTVQLEVKLNALWEKMISDFKNEFFSEKDSLRKFYEIEAENPEHLMPPSSSSQFLPSPVRPRQPYSGGSIIVDSSRHEPD
ncbi:MAG: hypothetical protein KF821_09325 [Anaerolineales bacterium]|nr:hypothetical protein [Anaerolineales bacterium]MBX3006009.1 hypothetical protein [Anaerolineales bacterium]